MVKIMLAEGVDPNFQEKDRNSFLNSAVCAGSTDIARCLLEAGAHAEGDDPEKITPFGEAVSRGNAEIMRLLMAFGVTLDRNDWNNVLARATENDHLEVVDLAIEYRADPSTIIRDYERGDHSILEMAIFHRNPIILQRFMDLHSRRPVFSSTALQRRLSQVVADNRPELVPPFLGLGLDLDSIRLYEGHTLLSLAQMKGFAMVEKLLRDAGMKRDLAFFELMRNFFRAVFEQDGERIRSLAASGADLQWEDGNRRTPLLAAMVFNRPRSEKILRELGAREPGS